MRTRYRRALTSVLMLALLVTVHGATGAEAVATAQAADRFPVGTILVTYDALRGRTYFATKDAVQVLGSEAEFKTTTPESMEASPDGGRLLLRRYYDSVVLRTSDLKLVRKLASPQTWWEGSRIGYYREDDECNDHVCTGGRERGFRLGRSRFLASDPRRSSRLGADSTGRYLLAVRQVHPGTQQNAGTPTNRLELWERTKTDHFRLLYVLATVEYDPGSVGDPHRLQVLNSRVAVFGYPLQIALDEDLVGVLQGGRVIAPLTDPKGRKVWFAQSPLIAGDAIVGLAIAEGEGGHLLDPANDRYFYQVSERSFVLRPVPSNVVFVTYHPRRGIGFGISDRDGVSVKWEPTAR